MFRQVLVLFLSCEELLFSGGGTAARSDLGEECAICVPFFHFFLDNSFQLISNGSIRTRQNYAQEH